ncbi:hypothetical protein C8R47DRAFT_1079266 [Mycena vitilis]|nr:hypothetical protein C8R47DRAFT_1079266 [Mycena vitilis]
MRVTMHTEIEPREWRPCPPLPLDGPILLEAAVHERLSDHVESSGPTASSGSSDLDWTCSLLHTPLVALLGDTDHAARAVLALECATPDLSSAQPPVISSVNSTRRYLSGLWMVFLALSILLLLCAALGIDLSMIFLASNLWNLNLFAVAPVLDLVSFGRSPDTSASVSCPAWQDSFVESCPHLDSGLMLLEYGPMLCPTDTRRGDVEFMARGWMRTSLALDAKRFIKTLCLPSTRRSLAARPLVGITSLVGGLMAMIKYKNPFSRELNPKVNHFSEGQSKQHKHAHVATNPGVRFASPSSWVAGVANLTRIATSLSSLVREALHTYLVTARRSMFRPGTMPAAKPISISKTCASCVAQSNVPSFVYADRDACNPSFECRCSLTYGGGLRQTISGRLLSPHLVEDNGIVAWIHREYVFESQLDMPVSSMLDLLTKGDVRTLSKMHDVWVPANMLIAQCKKLFENHHCSGCLTVVSVFRDVGADSTGKSDPAVPRIGRYAKPRKVGPTAARVAYDDLVKKSTNIPASHQSHCR